MDKTRTCSSQNAREYRHIDVSTLKHRPEAEVCSAEHYGFNSDVADTCFLADGLPKSGKGDRSGHSDCGGEKAGEYHQFHAKPPCT
ncbi:hypothetical protein SDC9_101074 [bioreactor metagenome]|uniref:Uncharacterized protein n=1 Tax=bioreactor metagenome TaxID=1076179 RepID=A0A645AN01_9ZZZZ